MVFTTRIILTNFNCDISFTSECAFKQFADEVSDASARCEGYCVLMLKTLG
jgi:hypothetical protein